MAHLITLKCSITLHFKLGLMVFILDIIPVVFYHMQGGTTDNFLCGNFDNPPRIFIAFNVVSIFSLGDSPGSIE